MSRLFFNLCYHGQAMKKKPATGPELWEANRRARTRKLELRLPRDSDLPERLTKRAKLEQVTRQRLCISVLEAVANGELG